MKKWLSIVAFSGLTTITNAQNLKQVNTLYFIGKISEAKAELDKVLKDPKLQNKSETWFWQYRLYAALIKQPDAKISLIEASKQSDAGFEKYIQLDKELTFLKDSKGEGASFDLYSSFNAAAINAYNNKLFDSAGLYFSKSVDYIDRIIKYKWTESKLAFDTTSILYAGVAFENAKKPNEAVKFYSRLADNKVAGKDYLGVYKFILLNAIDNKQKESFDKYLAISKELYPSENWELFELEYFSKAYTLEQKAAKFDEEDAAGKLSALQYAYYGEAFANATKEDKVDSSKLSFYKSKAIQAFKKSSDKKPEDGLSAYNVGVLSYNQFTELDDKKRENIRKLQALNTARAAEKDLKKKAATEAQYKESVEVLKKANADIETSTSDYVQTAITYLENAFKVLKEKKDRTSQEKNCLGRSVDFLSNLYAYKRDKAKGKDPKAYDTFDAKYKFYDELHGKVDNITSVNVEAIKIGMTKSQVLQKIGQPTNKSIVKTTSGNSETWFYEGFKKNIHFNDKGEVEIITISE